MDIILQNKFYDNKSLLTLNKNSICRRKSYSVNIKWKNHLVTIGGNSPVRIQSMTNTETTNIFATVMQIKELVQEGSELIRLAVNTPKAAQAISKIRDDLDNMGITVPLIGDFHYNGHLLLSKYKECAEKLSKYRINPGSIGNGSRREIQFKKLIEIAIKYNKPVRIGVNWGSIDKDLLEKMMPKYNNISKSKDIKNIMYKALIYSAINSAENAIKIGLKKNNIILSCKVSDIQDLILIYKTLASNCNYALHLGLTEAGMGSKGIIASTVALSILLQQGIGDTIRISLTPDLGSNRSKEVIVAKEILQSIGIRSFNPTIISCPGCGRTNNIFFQILVSKIKDHVNNQMPFWKLKYMGVENMHIAIMGCTVNGPGESKYANLGISLLGLGDKEVALVFIDGKESQTLRGIQIIEEFIQIINKYIKYTYKNLE